MAADGTVSVTELKAAIRDRDVGPCRGFQVKRLVRTLSDGSGGFAELEDGVRIQGSEDVQAVCGWAGLVLDAVEVTKDGASHEAFDGKKFVLAFEGRNADESIRRTEIEEKLKELIPGAGDEDLGSVQFEGIPDSTACNSLPENVTGVKVVITTVLYLAKHFF